MTLNPSIFKFVCIISLVVPGMSETIAMFLLAKRFRRVDLPALGGPIIDILSPSLMTSETLDYWIIFFIFSHIPLTSSVTS